MLSSLDTVIKQLHNGMPDIKVNKTTYTAHITMASATQGTPQPEVNNAALGELSCNQFFQQRQASERRFTRLFSFSADTLNVNLKKKTKKKAVLHRKVPRKRCPQIFFHMFSLCAICSPSKTRVVPCPPDVVIGANQPVQSPNCS